MWLQNSSNQVCVVYSESTEHLKSGICCLQSRCRTPQTRFNERISHSLASTHLFLFTPFKMSGKIALKVKMAHLNSICLLYFSMVFKVCYLHNLRRGIFTVEYFLMPYTIMNTGILKSFHEKHLQILLMYTLYSVCMHKPLQSFMENNLLLKYSSYHLNNNLVCSWN